MTYRPTLLSALLLGCIVFCCSGSASAEQVKANAPDVSDAWIREAPPGARAMAAFMVVESVVDDRLIGGHSGVAERLETHTHLHEDGMMKMRRIPALEVPAGERVELKPGGLHVMLINPTRSLVVGESVNLTLQFEQAGEIDVQAVVRAVRRRTSD